VAVGAIILLAILSFPGNTGVIAEEISEPPLYRLIVN